jgi:hypothetical protein
MSDQGKGLIQDLNTRVKAFQSGGMNAYDAIEQAASEFKLSILSEGESCRIYETPDGMLVNCWLDQFVENPAKRNEPFDNQVGWYTQEK